MTMRLFQQVLVLPLAALMAVATPAFADQRHAVDPSALAGAVSQHAARQDADRAAIREALARPEVQSTAATLGVDVARMSASVDTMSAAELARAANAARQVNDSLVGGASSVTISTTTLIIALLVVILLIVAIK
jgi:hypothetical protein